jgi:hypothetical protein
MFPESFQANSYVFTIFIQTTPQLSKVQGDNSWSKHGVSKPKVSTLSKIGDRPIQYCKMIGDSFLHS